MKKLLLNLGRIILNEVFRTSFPHPAVFWWVFREIFSEIGAIKKAERALISSLSALVPGIGVEPIRPCGHWCLRPARTSKNALKTQIDLAKECKTMHFRTQFPHSDRTPFLRI
jgi:hypothetical protein